MKIGAYLKLIDDKIERNQKINDKLFRITTLDNYQGKLVGKIGVGTTEKELLEVDPSFIYAQTPMLQWHAQG